MDIVVEKKVAAIKEEVVAEEEVAENEKEKEEEDSAMNIVTALESIGANIDNLERARAKPAEVTEVTSKEQCNSFTIVVYTGPLQVAFPTQQVADDAGAEPEIEEQFEDCAKPKEKKRKCSKDKKMKEGGEEKEEEETLCNHIDG
ncbi:hypothetical protein PVK06_039647 [Gossypium arboreum]|uniref:Uncharacterized protein n=1 Tax=Gossypium arboreum TaxID=29729 RepID=A0ABR0N5L2_GOSAR|nr:hypothetical protein PVK06_039647 [Gossypium arboreum]